MTLVEVKYCSNRMEEIEKAEAEHNKAEQVKASVAAPLHPEATISKAQPKKVKMKRVLDTDVKPDGTVIVMGKKIGKIKNFKKPPGVWKKPKGKKAAKVRKLVKKLLKKKPVKKAKRKKPAKKKAFKRSKSKPSRKSTGKKISIEKKKRAKRISKGQLKKILAKKKKSKARKLMNFKVSPSEQKELAGKAKRWAKNNKSAYARVAILKYKPKMQDFKTVSSQLGR